MNFDIGKQTEQAHEYTSALIEEAYRRKEAGNPVTPAERVQKAQELCEAHYAQIGIWPAPSVLTRLAWYIIFDTMTDKNEHKVRQTEYPILSEYQIETRKRREKALVSVYTGKNDTPIGRQAGTDGTKRRIFDYMTPARDDYIVPTEYLDLYDALDNAGLTDRQRQAIELVYFEGLTQEVAGEVMGVGQDVVSRHVAKALRKIREYMTKVNE